MVARKWIKIITELDQSITYKFLGSNCHHMNQHTGPQGTPESNFRVNLVPCRRADWPIPQFGSTCTRADKLLDSDVGRSLQTSCSPVAVAAKRR
jgi:hypothetical protein